MNTTTEYVYSKIVDKFGRNIDDYSALYYEEVFVKLLNKLKPKVVLEIGTWKGLVSGLLALYCEKVYTIDIVGGNQICPQQKVKTTYDVWQFLNVKDKIYFYRATNNTDKKHYIQGLNFDFAFIDGDHTEPHVRFDFEMIKNKCEYVLFHDYSGEVGVREVVNSLVPNVWEIKVGGIGGKTGSSFAFWLANLNNPIVEWLNKEYAHISNNPQ